MAEASTEIPGGPNTRRYLEAGIHAAYFFDLNSEKQLKLFPLCREFVDSKNASLIYIAGKQGVKGIRLSLKDIGFDVASYEKNKQMKIADSEEWFLSSGRQQQFRPIAELGDKIRQSAKESSESGFSFLAIISETDMLARKGFISDYQEFDILLNRIVPQLKVAIVCAYDKRELVAAGIGDVLTSIRAHHSLII
jgi:hypothetical protein